jgi:peptidoglycan/xylan/chitin deacetylase (PgdA/CDA1 family)
MSPARLLLYAATAGVLVVAARAVLIAPPPLYVSIGVAVTYLAILLSGVLVLRLRMFADAVVEGPFAARGVVLTFDDGPDPATTPRVLDILDAAGAKATFFVIGKKAAASPELVKDIVARGHEVGLHSFSHDRFFSLRDARGVRRDLELGVATLERITGARPTYFRPPIGHTNPSIARVADALDLTIVGWSAAGRDGVGWAKPASVTARVRRGLRDGAIVALHDAAERGGREPAGVAALGDILKAIEAEQLTVVPLRTWISSQAPPEAPPPAPSHADGSSTTNLAPDA